MTLPYKLLTNYLLQERSNYFHDKTIFEAGFRDIGYILQLYKNFRFFQYTGVDIIRENELMISYNHDKPIPDTTIQIGGDTAFKRYQSYCNDSNNISPFNQEQFEKIFKLNFETTIENYIQNNPIISPKINVAIFNKLFHRLENKEIPKKILNWLKINSSNNSLLLFSVNLENQEIYENKDESINIGDYIYTENDVLSLINSVNGVTIFKEFQDKYFLSCLVKFNLT